jgi:hypothetical protein
MNERDLNSIDPLDTIRAVPPSRPTTPLASPNDPVGTRFETPERDLTLPPAESLTIKETLTDRAAVLTSQARTTLDGWKQSVTTSVNDAVERAKPVWNERVDTTKAFVADQVANVKSRAQETGTTFQAEIRNDTAKWAGIAAGAGFAVGLLGRWLHHRAHHRVPAVLVIEGNC